MQPKIQLEYTTLEAVVVGVVTIFWFFSPGSVCNNLFCLSCNSHLENIFIVINNNKSLSVNQIKNIKEWNLLRHVFTVIHWTFINNISCHSQGTRNNPSVRLGRCKNKLKYKTYHPVPGYLRLSSVIPNCV